MFNQYPYINLNDLNLDYILKAIKEMRYEVTNFVSINAIKYANPIQWNITSQYEKNTIVIDPQTGTAYISVAAVPAGVALTRPEYWTVVFDLGSFVTRAAKNFTTRYEQDTTTTATFPTAAGEWLVWGDTLYVANVNITAGDSYVVDSNIRHITVEEVKNTIMQLIADNYDAIVAMIGDLNDLTTTDKSNLVVAINEVIATLFATTGALSDLTTTDKSNLVAAINEVITTLFDTTGALSDLTTIDKSNLVAAINEVNSTGGGAIGMIGDLDDLGTTDKSNVVNAINEVLGDISALDDKYGVVCVSDFSPTLGGADDSTAMQNAIDFAKNHNMTLVSFKDIPEISFKNISITSSITLLLGDCVIQGLQKNDECIYNLFDITGSDIDVTFIGGTIRGLLDVGGYSTGPVEPIVFVHNVKSFALDSCVIEYINNDYTSIQTSIVDRIAATFTIHDCKHTTINNCYFDHIRGEENMFILDDELNRGEVNMEMTNCVFGSDMDTTVVDFIGNNCILRNNTYNLSYGGSVVNAFALNLVAENEVFNGTIVNMYDNTEGGFQGRTATFKNIRCAVVQTGFMISSQFVDIDGVSIANQNTVDNYMRVLALATGYGGLPTTLHKDVSTTLCWIRNVTIKNVDLRLLNFTAGNEIMFVHAMVTQSIVWNVTPQIQLEGCMMVGGNSGVPIKAAKCDVTLINCYLRPHVYPSISGATRMALIFRATDNAQPTRIKVIGCTVENYDPSVAEYLLYSNAAPYVVIGCVATGASDKINATTYSGSVGVAGNINLATT